MERGMAYTVTNFKTKKALKKSVKFWDNIIMKDTNFVYAIRCFNPSLGPDLSNFTGKICLEGPHYPAAHTWYAEAELVNGIVVKVK